MSGNLSPCSCQMRSLRAGDKSVRVASMTAQVVEWAYKLSAQQVILHEQERCSCGSGAAWSSGFYSGINQSG